MIKDFSISTSSFGYGKSHSNDVIRENIHLSRRICELMKGDGVVSRSVTKDTTLNHPGTIRYHHRRKEAKSIEIENSALAERIKIASKDLTDTTPYHDKVVIPPPKKRTPIHLKKTKPSISLSPDINQNSNHLFPKLYSSNDVVKTYNPSDISQNLSASNFYNSSYNSKLIKSFQQKPSNQMLQIDSIDNYFRFTHINCHMKDNILMDQIPQKMIIQYIKYQDDKELDLIIMKRPYINLYSILGYDITTKQKYQLQLTHPQIIQIVRSELPIVKSLDHIEVWMCFIDIITLPTVDRFDPIENIHLFEFLSHSLQSALHYDSSQYNNNNYNANTQRKPSHSSTTLDYSKYSSKYLNSHSSLPQKTSMPPLQSEVGYNEVGYSGTISSIKSQPPLNVVTTEDTTTTPQDPSGSVVLSLSPQPPNKARPEYAVTRLSPRLLRQSGIPRSPAISRQPSVDDDTDLSPSHNDLAVTESGQTDMMAGHSSPGLTGGVDSGKDITSLASHAKDTGGLNEGSDVSLRKDVESMIVVPIINHSDIGSSSSNEGGDVRIIYGMSNVVGNTFLEEGPPNNGVEEGQQEMPSKDTPFITTNTTTDQRQDIFSPQNPMETHFSSINPLSISTASVSLPNVGAVSVAGLYGQLGGLGTVPMSGSDSLAPLSDSLLFPIQSTQQQLEQQEQQQEQQEKHVPEEQQKKGGEQYWSWSDDITNSDWSSALDGTVAVAANSSDVNPLSHTFTPSYSGNGGFNFQSFANPWEPQLSQPASTPVQIQPQFPSMPFVWPHATTVSVENPAIGQPPTLSSEGSVVHVDKSSGVERGWDDSAAGGDKAPAAGGGGGGGGGMSYVGGLSSVEVANTTTSTELNSIPHHQATPTPVFGESTTALSIETAPSLSFPTSPPFHPFNTNPSPTSQTFATNAFSFMPSFSTFNAFTFTPQSFDSSNAHNDVDLSTVTGQQVGLDSSSSSSSNRNNPFSTHSVSSTGSGTDTMTAWSAPNFWMTPSTASMSTSLVEQPSNTVSLPPETLPDSTILMSQATCVNPSATLQSNQQGNESESDSEPIQNSIISKSGVAIDTTPRLGSPPDPLIRTYSWSSAPGEWSVDGDFANATTLPVDTTVDVVQGLLTLKSQQIYTSFKLPNTLTRSNMLIDRIVEEEDEADDHSDEEGYFTNNNDNSSNNNSKETLHLRQENNEQNAIRYITGNSYGSMYKIDQLFSGF